MQAPSPERRALTSAANVQCGICDRRGRTRIVTSQPVTFAAFDCKRRENVHVVRFHLSLLNKRNHLNLHAEERVYKILLIHYSQVHAGKQHVPFLPPDRCASLEILLGSGCVVLCDEPRAGIVHCGILLMG